MKNVYIQQEKALHEQVNNAIKIKEMLDTKGWRELVGPMLEKEIISIVGGKTNSGFTMGKLNSKCKKDETLAYYIGAKDALVCFYNGIQEAIKAGEDARKKLSEKGKPKKNMIYGGI